MSRAWVIGLAAAMIAGALSMGDVRAQMAPDASAPAAEDAAPAKAAAKPKAAKRVKPKAAKLPSIAVVVRNLRSVGLIELDAALTSGGDSAKIVGPLAAGKKVIAHLPHDKSCQFDLHGSFADGAETDVSGVELCKDKKIDLTD